VYLNFSCYCHFCIW